MDQNELERFKVIGKIQSTISNAKNFKDAITSCLKIVVENKMADYIIIWKTDLLDNPILHPKYWICPIDLSSCSYHSGEGIVGRAFLSHKPETIFNFKKENEIDLFDDFSSLDIGSVTCVPLILEDRCFGCVEFIRLAENGHFSQDDIDTFELLTLMSQSEIETSGLPENPTTKKNVLLSVKNIHKSFKNGENIINVLKGVNFNICEGEFVCLLGESGCGKSTMLNIVGGLLDFDKGSINFAGNDLTNLSKKKLTYYRRNNIGFIFQSYNLMPNLSAKQNIDLISDLVDNPVDSKELLELVGLADKSDSYPSQLSGGEQQRVAIARALVKKPKLILGDEPTAALDYETSIEVLSLLENITKKGTAMMIVTHNEEITKMADKVIRFKNGKVFEVEINSHPLKASDLVW